jgi:hypothetical protein
MFGLGLLVAFTVYVVWASRRGGVGIPISAEAVFVVREQLAAPSFASQGGWVVRASISGNPAGPGSTIRTHHEASDGSPRNPGVATANNCSGTGGTKHCAHVRVVTSGQSLFVLVLAVRIWDNRYSGGFLCRLDP